MKEEGINLNSLISIGHYIYCRYNSYTPEKSYIDVHLYIKSFLQREAIDHSTFGDLVAEMGYQSHTHTHKRHLMHIRKNELIFPKVYVVLFKACFFLNSIICRNQRQTNSPLDTIG